MAAGGYKEFVAGETLDQDEINDFLMQGMLVFAGTAARGSAIGTPVEGQFSFLKDSDSVEFYDGSAWVEFSSGLPEFNYVVVGGGGGGAGGENVAGDSGGGGGAGGYRCSVSGESSGGGGTAEAPIYLASGSYTVTIGAGGSGGAVNGIGTRGNESFFGPIVSVGGGNGSQRLANSYRGANGGSGGGASGFFSLSLAGGKAVSKQGFDGEAGDSSSREGGGGGGAAEAGGTDAARDGGDGVASSITGSSVTRAGGGGAGGRANPGGNGGTGGGGDGGDDGSNNATAGAVNTGGGGGGGGTNGGTGKAGGSGVVIIKYPDNITLTIGAGLTSTTSTSGGFKVTTFTAGTDTVTVP